MSIKNIIFDLGGVIFDIDFKRTQQAFNQLGSVLDFQYIYSQNEQDHLFDDFEIGKISPQVFREKINKKCALQLSDEKFDAAWNAMLLHLPKERLDLIKSLKMKYKIFLFSNTNAIHLKEVFNICQKQHGFNHFDDYFDKQYYSFIFGQRKPHGEAFISILNENQLKPEETLFVDDSLQHIVGAQSVGLQVMHLSKEKSIGHVPAFLAELDSYLS